MKENVDIFNDDNWNIEEKKESDPYKCKYCGKSTKSIDYEYLLRSNIHLDCFLKESFMLSNNLKYD